MADSRIFHSLPLVGEAEKVALARVVDSQQLSMGSEVLALEREMAIGAGQSQAIAVSSGSSALYLALVALGVRSGDSVIIPSYVCTALLNAVALCGAEPVICDVDSDTGLMRPDDVQPLLSSSTRAIIVPHLFGRPAPVAEIAALGVPVIEDCAQCIGTTWAGKMVGSMGTISVFSFYATKLVAAGEGGLIATSDPDLADRIRSLRCYDNVDTWQQRLNFKLSDLHAAVARVQLQKLDVMNQRRRQIALRYFEVFTANSLFNLQPAIGCQKHVFFRYVLKLGSRSDAFIVAMRARGIDCSRPIYKPLHQYLHRDGCPNTEHLQQSAVSIPLYPALSDDDVERVAETAMAVAEEIA